MFGDSDALVLSLAARRRQRYQEWEAAVERQVESRAGDFRVLVMELGCGSRVRSISDEALCVYGDINAISARCGAAPAATLLRINPAADCFSSVHGSIVQIQGGAEEVTASLPRCCAKKALAWQGCCMTLSRRCCNSCSRRCMQFDLESKHPNEHHPPPPPSPSFPKASFVAQRWAGYDHAVLK
jgi:hypothetical protein